VGGLNIQRDEKKNKNSPKRLARSGEPMVKKKRNVFNGVKRPGGEAGEPEREGKRENGESSKSIDVRNQIDAEYYALLSE